MHPIVATLGERQVQTYPAGKRGVQRILLAIVKKPVFFTRTTRLGPDSLHDMWVRACRATNLLGKLHSAVRLRIRRDSAGDSWRRTGR